MVGLVCPSGRAVVAASRVLRDVPLMVRLLLRAVGALAGSPGAPYRGRNRGGRGAPRARAWAHRRPNRRPAPRDIPKRAVVHSMLLLRWVGQLALIGVGAHQLLLLLVHLLVARVAHRDASVSVLHGRSMGIRDAPSLRMRMGMGMRRGMLMRKRAGVGASRAGTQHRLQRHVAPIDHGVRVVVGVSRGGHLLVMGSHQPHRVHVLVAGVPQHVQIARHLRRNRKHMGVLGRGSCPRWSGLPHGGRLPLKTHTPPLITITRIHRDRLDIKSYPQDTILTRSRGKKEARHLRSFT